MAQDCDTCTHDGGRTCKLIDWGFGQHTEPNVPKRAKDTLTWARRYCDDESLRPLPHAPPCPGWEGTHEPSQT